MGWSEVSRISKIACIAGLIGTLTAGVSSAAEPSPSPTGAVAVQRQPGVTAAPVAPSAELTPPEVPVGSRLTLDQALQAAARQNPTYLAAQQAAVSAYRYHRAQRLPLDPQVSVVSGYDTNIGTFDEVHPEDISLTFVLETSGRRSLRSRASEAQYRQALADAETARQTLKLGVTNAYVGLQVANTTLDAQKELYRLVARQGELTEQQFKLGAARENDVLRLQIALSQAEQAVIQANGTVLIARATLNQQLGRSADTAIDAADTLQYHPIALDTNALNQLAYANRPELKSEEQALKTLQVAVAQQRSQYIPDVNLSVRPDALVDHSYNSGSTNALYTAWINFPLPLGSIKHQIRKAQSDVKAEEDRREAVRTQTALDVQTAITNLRASQKIAESYQAGVLTRASSLVERTQKGFEIGGASILDVIDAQTTYRTTLVSYYQALGNYQQAVAQLERAIGTAAPQSPAAR